MNDPRVGLYGTRDKAEERGLTRTVLSHEGQLHAAANRKRDLVEDRFAGAEFVGDVLEPDYRVIFGHFHRTLPHLHQNRK